MLFRSKAGLRRGDVVTEVNGTAIANADDLQSKVENTRVGDSLELKIRRGDRTQMMKIKTAELRDQTS